MTVLRHVTKPRNRLCGKDYPFVLQLLAWCDLSRIAFQMAIQSISRGSQSLLQIKQSPSLWRGLRTLLSSTAGEITPSPLGQYDADDAMREFNIDPAIKMPGDVDGLERTLKEISQRKDLSLPAQRHLTKTILANFCLALGSARSCDEVSVVVLGGTGQGKSRTINKLVGQPLFNIGNHRSTTKDVVRASVPACRDGIEVTFSLYDTPGFLDTSKTDRERNAVTLRRFFLQTFATSMNHDIKERLLNLLEENSSQPASVLRLTLRPERFPNAILVMSTWNHVKEDALNAPKDFTSALGHSILSLKTNNLVDAGHPNVIVVVTRALADTKEDLEGEFGSMEFTQEWKDQARQKRKIIIDIQQALFPRSQPWPTVFVENGKPNDYVKYEWLPDNRQSHQNLFEELRHIFSDGATNGVKDLLGLHALASVISGTTPQIKGTVKHEVVVHIPEGEHIPEEEIRLACDEKAGQTPIPDTQPVKEDKVKERAFKLLGHSFNPVRNFVSTGPVVDQDADLPVDISWNDRFDDISLISAADAAQDLRVSKVQLSIDGDTVLSTEANNKTASGKAQPKNILEASKIVARISLGPLPISLSPRMVQSIGGLPQWYSESEESCIEYQSFFELHGTHVIISVALGGQVHIPMPQGFDETLLTDVLQNGRPLLPGSSLSDSVNQISCRGGHAAQKPLVKALETMLWQAGDGDLPPYEDWHTVRAHWSKELLADPITLTYLPQTSFMRLHAASGLTHEQRTDLAKAADWYTKGGKVKPQEPPKRSTNLPREENARGADKDRRKGQKGFFAWIGSKCVIQ